MQVATIKIKAEDGGYKIINLSDFNPKTDHPFDDEASAQAKALGTADDAAEKLAAERRAQANFGQFNGNGTIAEGRNPSGTFSEPTPTDIRYPDKNATEFENNHGAFVGASAADLRAQEGLEDKPGGLEPELHEEIKEAEDAAALASAQAVDDAKRTGPATVDDDDGDKSLDDMKVDELKAYAKEHDIDLGDATRKDDIRDAIKAAQADAE